MEERLYGHKKMIVWQMADRLDALVQDVLKKMPRTEFKLREQLDSASDSIGSNFVEGYYANSLKEYIKFCSYSKRSIAEVQHRLRRIFRKQYISEREYGEADSVAAKTMYLFDRLIEALMSRQTREARKTSVKKV